MMRKAGVNDDSAVVVVSKGEGSKDLTFGTRLYWTLKYFGHDNVALLDGGMKKWLNDGRKTVGGAGDAGAGNFTAKAPIDGLLAGDAQMLAAVEDPAVQLLDGRDQDYYLGLEQKDYVYAKGHVSTAKNLPHPTLFKVDDKAATFRDPAELKALPSSAGIDPSAPAIV